MIREEAFGDNRIDPDDTGVQTTWVAYTALKSLVESMDESRITAAKVTKALKGGASARTPAASRPRCAGVTRT